MNKIQPLYVQVKEKIIDAISSGRYEPGDQLPSQRDLAEEFNLSHMTVRRIITDLINDDVIYSIPGKGIFVSEGKQEAESSPLVSFTEEMKRRGMQPSSKILASEIIYASTPLASLFKVEVGFPLFYLRRLRLADDKPIAVQASYLRHSRCQGITERDLENQSLYDVLCHHFNLCLMHGEMSIEAALADQEHANLLGAQLPCALLITEQLTYLDNGEVIEFTRSAYRGDRYHLRK